MVSIHQFNRLTNPEKFGLLEDHAVYLQAFRMDGPNKVALFSMPGFYVEVWLNQKTDQLTKAQAFSSYKKLDPFLSCIDLTEVYSCL